MPGRSVSHYRILERVGAGTMGVVYKAEDERLGRLVALKFLPEHLGEREENKRRFIQEARSTSSLDHENLCTVYDIGETEDGQIFIAMPFYDGETLKERMERGPLPLNEALDIGMQLAEGLSEAHKHGIVHRDLKPANVMVTRAGKVKIVDFGLAKLLDEVSHTKTGATLGTVAYMSPEQAKGGKIDGRTDIWALGVVLYKMLTGKRPFGGDNQPAMLYSILNRNPTPISEIADVPPALDGILEKALEKDVDRRYASASELLADLRSARLQLGLASQDEISLVLPRIRRARIRRRVLLTAVLIAVTAAAVFLAQLRTGEANVGRGLAVLPLTNLTGDSSFDYLGEGLSASLTSRLSEISDLEVISRAEVASASDPGVPATTLAQHLGAAYLVEGQIQRQAQQLQVSLNLVDGVNGAVAFHWDFTGDMQHLTGLQNNMAQALTQYFSIPLSFKERRRMARNPTDSSRAYDQLLRGLSFYNQAAQQPDMLDLAIESFQSAVKLDPDFALAWAYLSYSHWSKYVVVGHQVSEIEAARKAAQRAAKLDPELPDAQIALAQVERASGDMEQSMQRIRELLKKTPNPVLAYGALSSNYERLGKNDQAIAFRQAATQAEPDNWRSWYDLGLLYARLSHLEEAKAAFERAEPRAPADVSLPIEMQATVALQQGHIEEALNVYERLPRPIHSSVLAVNLGTAYYFSQRPDRFKQAAKYYRIAVDLQPNDAVLRRNLGDLLHTMGQRQEAQQQYGKALSLILSQLKQDPGNRQLRFELPIVTAKTKDCDQALTLAHDRLPDAVSGLEFHELAATYALCGATPDALDAVRAALSHGYPANQLVTEDEFQPLKKLPEFDQIIHGKTPAG
jgi:serine/threonine protein kinase/Flp pilus assembly protein TadD